MSIIYLILFLFIMPASAVSYLEVVINEVAWMGDFRSANHEWIELYNPQPYDVDLTDWYLTADDGSPAILLAGTLASSSYYLLERTSDEAVVSTTADLIYTGSLSNTSEILSLYCADHLLVDRINSSTNWLAGDNDLKLSMQRVSSTLPALTDNWLTATPTPSSMNYILTTTTSDVTTSSSEIIEPTSTPIFFQFNDVVISNYDALASPEWIEIYNATTSVVDLLDWELHDRVGRIYLLTDGRLGVDEYLTLTLPSARLNNDGDEIKLYDNRQVLIYQTSYSHEPEPEPVEVEQKTQDNVVAYSQGAVMVSEFVSDPVAGQTEWIELLNTTDSNIDLTGWQILDASGKATELQGYILAGGYYLAVQPKGNLNNDGDLIAILDPTGQTIHQIEYGDCLSEAVCVPVASDPASVAWDGTDYVVTQTLTPGYANYITPQEIDGPIQQTEIEQEPESAVCQTANIYLSEFYPNPVGSDAQQEYIELFNPGLMDLDLTNWLLDDTEGGSPPFNLTGYTLKALDYLVLSRAETNLALNNSQDEVRLMDCDNNLVDRVVYAQTQEGVSYIYEADWQGTVELTPGYSNEYVPLETDATMNETEVVEIALDQVRSLPLKSLVRVKGWVAVEPGILGSQFFYLAGSGIQVYSSKKDFPELQVGDYLEVTGELSESQNEFRLKIAQAEDIIILRTDDPPEPQTVNTGQVAEDWEGYLVTVHAEVIEVSGSRLYLDDGSGELVVYLKQATGIDKKQFAAGQWLTVTGIVSQVKEEYRLLPRFKQDIVLEQVEAETTVASVEDIQKQPVNYVKYGWLLLVTVLIGLGVYFYRAKMILTPPNQKTKIKDITK